MPIAWFICPYKRRIGAVRPTRYTAMDDFTPQIFGEGGDWSEVEVLGDCAIVKVRASSTTLSTIAAEPGYTRIPLALLDQPLSSLTVAQRNAIRNRILAMGYTTAELTAALGTNLGSRTLGEVLRFAATRRLMPRYDAVNDVIVLDGPAQSCRSVDEVDATVTEA